MSLYSKIIIMFCLILNIILLFILQFNTNIFEIADDLMFTSNGLILSTFVCYLFISKKKGDE